MTREPGRHEMPLLRRADLSPDPMAQFAGWWDVAEREVPLADAMTLATVRADGSPDARMVLLKGHDERGFRFFTNFESSKGRQLEASPYAALIIYWRELDRQVRARGTVSRLSAEESDAYFASRAPGSRLGAWASPQSRALAGRAELEQRLQDARERLGESDDIPRPEFWGGYLVRPDEVEFWQGQRARLHDRFVYRRGPEAWDVERLAP
jgi:pyridoxamine 5'-phosphate oxidase